MPPESKSKDLARVGMSVTGAVVEIVAASVPIPGLQAAASTARKIFALVDQMRMNKRRTQLLAVSVRELVRALEVSMSDLPAGALESTLATTVDEFSEILVTIEKRLEEISQLKFLQRLLQYASVQDELAELEAQARESCERCKLKLNIDLKRQQIINELVRQQDNKAMMERLESSELARKEDVKALKVQLQALVRDPAGIADAIGLHGSYIDKDSRDALQSLSLEIFARPAAVEPEMRGFVEEATKVIRSRTNYHGPRTRPWVMKRSAFERHTQIGAGGFSVVYKGRWKEGGMDVAIKEFLNGDDIDDVMDELWIWRKLEHANLLPFIGGALEAPYFAVSPYCKAGNVLEYLAKHHEADRLQVVIDITKGLECLHACHVVHGDLKARNVLINDQGTALVADFGLSRLHSLSSSHHPSHASGHAGTIHWLAPELLIDGRSNPSFENDVWAFSMTLYEIYTNGRVPFAEIPDSQSLYSHLKNGARPLQLGDPGASGYQLAWNLMQRCSAFLPQDRPKFSWILFLMDSLYPIFQTNHPQLLSEAPSKFRNVDWSETIFSQWPQGLIALSDLLTSNLEDRSRDDTDSIHGPVRDIQSQIVLQILGSVAGMAQNYTSWYTKTRSKEVYTSLANAGVIHVLDLALKRPESDIKLDACAVIRRLFGGKSRGQFEAPPPAYRALSFKIQDSGCMESLVELCRSAQSSESSQAILSTVRTLLALTPDPSARRSSWDDAKALVTNNV